MSPDSIGMQGKRRGCLISLTFYLFLVILGLDPGIHLLPFDLFLLPFLAWMPHPCEIKTSISRGGMTLCGKMIHGD